MSVAESRLNAGPETRGDYLSVAIADLKAGAALQQPLFDGREGNRQLLLAAGKTVLPSYLENLRARGIDAVMIHRSDWERLESAAAAETAVRERASRSSTSSSENLPHNPSSRASWSGWKTESDSFRHRLKPPLNMQRDPVRSKLFEEAYSARVEVATGLFQTLAVMKSLDAAAAHDVCAGQLRELAEDFDEFLIRSTAPVVTDYPSRHGVQTAMLAMGMAAIMGYIENDLIDLGIGSLMHDVGMLLVPEHLLKAGGAITSSERLEIQKHPIHSANLLQECRDFPQQSRHVVYQMHERLNGSGYPRGRVGTQIHPLARIAAVADTYLALVSPRPFREALLPYQAVERLLMAARQGQFDPGVVRALLYSLSLFPIGSYVQLTDGRAAQVIRTNRENFSRPVVQIVDYMGTGPAPVIDLARDRKLAVRSVLPFPTFQGTSAMTSPEELIAAASSL